jgi:hypothetical protein
VQPDFEIIPFSCYYYLKDRELLRERMEEGDFDED